MARRIQRNRRFRGTRLCPQSLVCYTFGDRGWRKGVVRGGNKHFPSAQNRRILARHALKFRICPRAKSACSCVGDVAERREFRKKFLERSSITGGAKGISSPVPPQRRYSPSSSYSASHFGQQKSSSLSLAKNAFMQFLQSFRLEVSSASMKLNII